MKSLSDREVLQATLDKTYDNGYIYLGKLSVKQLGDNVFEITNGKEVWSVEEIVFSHPFTKAFFQKGEPDIWHWISTDGKEKGHGSRETLESVTGKDFISEWQYHGTQMFLAEDRIDYLRRNI